MNSDLLGGRYRIEKSLGSGEMGSSYLARDDLLGIPVAIKIIHTNQIRDREVFTNFYNTFRAYINLEHNDIVKALDSGLVASRPGEKPGSLDEQVPFLIFEYFAGAPISTICRGKALPIPVALRHFYRILDVVEYMHGSGFIHHGIKSSNILIDESGEIRLLHFGITPRKLHPVKTRKEWSSLITSACYTSPEIAAWGIGDTQSDYYSLGILLYELLTGRVPFNGSAPEDIYLSHINNPPPSMRKLNPDIPVKLENIVFCLLEKDPRNRFASLSDLTKKLKEVESAQEALRDAREQNRILPCATFPVITPILRRRAIEREIKGFIRDAGKGKGSLLLIKGSRGAGKSRLMDELGVFSRLFGIPFYSRGCFRDLCPPYEPFISIVRDMAAQKGRTISKIVDPPHDRVLATLLGERGFRAIEAEDPNRPFVQEHQVFESVLSFFSRIPGKTVNIISISDLHWAPENVLKLLEYLVAGLESGRIAIIVTYNGEAATPESIFPELRKRLRELAGVKELEIPALSTAESARIIKSVTGADNFSEGLVEKISEKSRGNPLYIIESMRQLMHDERILFEDNVLKADPDDISWLPDNVFDVVMRRVINLPAKIKEFYKSAACIGKRFTFELLQEAMGKIPDEMLHDLLSRGKRQGFHLEEKRGEATSFVFSHSIYRDAFYDLIPQGERKERHAAIGNIIEELHFNNLVDYFEDLVMHFRLSDDDDRTIRYMIKAADKSALVGAYSRAISYYMGALSLIGGRTEKTQERWKCFRNLGIIHMRLKEPEKALDVQAKALDLSDKKRDILAIQENLFLIADIYMGLGDWKKAADTIERALVYETMRDSLWKCKLLSRRGKLAMLNNYKERSFEDALSDVRDSFRIAQDLRNLDASIEISEILSEIYIAQNLADEGERALSKILKFRTGVETQLRIMEKLGKLFFFPGSDYSKAHKYFSEGLSISGRIEDSRNTANFSSHIGNYYAITGDIEKAMLCFEKSVFIQGEGGYSEGLAQSYSYLADLCFYKGDFASSREYINKTRDLLKLAPNREIEAEIQLRAGYVELSEGNIDLSRRCFEHALNISQELSLFKGIFFSLLGLSGIFLKEGNLYSARTHFVEASRSTKKGESRFGSAYLMLLQGIAFRLDENQEMALTLLSKSRENLEKLGRPYELGLVNLEIARAHLLGGDGMRLAKTFYGSAKECFQKLENLFMIRLIEEEMGDEVQVT